MAEWKLKTGLDYAAAEVITLGGVQRFVPVLAMRQNRVVVPLMMQVLPVIEAASVRENAAGERIMPSAEIGLRMFNGETIEAMSTMVFVALTRAYEISADDFLDEAISVQELAEAMPAIVKQTRFFRPASEGRKKSPGEEMAANQ